MQETRSNTFTPKLKVRIGRTRVLTFGGIVLLLWVGGGIRIALGDSDSALLVAAAIGSLGVAIGVVNFWAIHRLELGEDSLRHISLLGLRVNEIRLHELSEVTEGVVQGHLFENRSFRFTSGRSVIEIVPTIYDRSALRELLDRLDRAKVHVRLGDES